MPIDGITCVGAPAASPARAKIGSITERRSSLLDVLRLDRCFDLAVQCHGAPSGGGDEVGIGRSRRCAPGGAGSAPTRKPIAPTNVPRLTSSTLRGCAAVRARRYAAIAETPNATEPAEVQRARSTTTRTCGRHESQRCPTSANASSLATRKQIEPNDVRTPDEAVGLRRVERRVERGEACSR